VTNALPVSDEDDSDEDDDWLVLEVVLGFVLGVVLVTSGPSVGGAARYARTQCADIDVDVGVPDSSRLVMCDPGHLIVRIMLRDVQGSVRRSCPTD